MLTITPQEYANFKTYLEKSCGILLGDNKHYLLVSRLSRLLKDEGLASIEDLTKQLGLRPRSELKQNVIDAMTTNETYWFRDNHPYTIFTNKLLPEIEANKPTQKIRIWSAACSFGQEPYSLSMLIDDLRVKIPSIYSKGVEIMATDISTEALNAAKQGEYDGLAMGRGMPKDKLKTYFTHTLNNTWQVKEPIKKRVQFRHLNLQESFSLLGKFDVVFCRNVLIYFAPALKEDIIRRIHATLKPKGYLILGASESLGGAANLFDMVQCKPGIIYQAK